MDVSSCMRNATFGLLRNARGVSQEQTEKCVPQ
jgi:hypothetical protein